ncbi:MAG: choline/ethanolamine kinase family protein [Paracoccaceae bacterium]
MGEDEGRARVAALPCWRGGIAAERLTGGLSNEIWKVTDDGGAHVVRFGRDYPFHHVFRDREAMVARAAAAAGFGPAVEYAGPGVMVTAYLDARTWGAAEVAANPGRVGRLLREFHTRMGAGIEGAAFLFWPFHVVRDYARTLRAGGSAHVGDLPVYLALNEALEAAQVPMPIVFGHHDLLPANFLETADGRLWLIDYEYAGFGTAMFDLAGAAANAGMDEAQAGALLAAYFGATPDGATRRAFDAMQVAALLREAMWAMVSELHLNAPGVDYGAYTGENLTKLGAAKAAFSDRYGNLP